MESFEVSALIMAIRKNAGNPCEKCPTCGKNPNEPFRIVIGGKITQGCIDAAHDNNLISQEDISWHDRPEAKKQRERELFHLRSIGR
jgi:hypothetical protein